MSTPISKQTLQAFLFDTGVNVATCLIHAPDEFYALPEAAWIAGEFADGFRIFQQDYGLGQYRKGDSDCDDFAECAKFYAAALHRRTRNQPKESSLAFAEFHYQRGGQGGSGHAINAAVCREGERLRLVFFEPQRAALTELTKEEIGSAFLVKF